MPPDTAPGNFEASKVPRLAAVGHRWGTVAARDTYPEGLNALVDGLLAQATKAKDRPAR
ncbi:hypothetical protein [Streptomyces armeniacus]|uniref:hypothetical protein n=1 Tax=Streptomyces armeniacus TaxID=83291 RepID=UPI001C9B8A58|nr:hypothetical protein [Streptomyces armeniacus]